MMKPYRDAVLTPDKRCFNYRSSRSCLVTEGTFEKLKRRFQILYRKCESNIETVKIMGLACVIHYICINKRYLVPIKFNSSYNIVSNKHRESNKLKDLLGLTDSNVKKFETGRVVAVIVQDKTTEVLSWSEG